MCSSKPFCPEDRHLGHSCYADARALETERSRSASLPPPALQPTTTTTSATGSCLSLTLANQAILQCCVWNGDFGHGALQVANQWFSRVPSTRLCDKAGTRKQHSSSDDALMPKPLRTEARLNEPSEGLVDKCKDNMIQRCDETLAACTYSYRWHLHYKRQVCSDFPR